MQPPPRSLPGRNDKPQRPRRRRALALVAASLALWWLGGAAAMLVATAPTNRAIRALPRFDAREVEEASARAVDGVTTRAWWIDAGAGARAVVLCAGIRGDRERMLDRARFYLARGWSALLVDLRGTGESDPARVTMGWHEALDLLAWRSWLAGRGVTDVGVHGQSLGAAAAAFSALRDPTAGAWSFLVLEACYATLEEAVAARAPGLPAPLYWPMLWLAEWALDLDVGGMDAVAALRLQQAPTLLVCGDRDASVGPGALKRLFDASAAPDKALHEVRGVAHKDLWSLGGAELRRALERFLARR